MGVQPELREYLKKELRGVREHNKNSIFKDRIPVKIINHGGFVGLPSIELYVEPIWYRLSEQDVDELYREIDQEDKEAEYKIGIKAEIERENEVNGTRKPSFFEFSYWWNFDNEEDV